MNPRISVVMSVRNGASELPRAMRSLLAQTCADFELIAVNDGSTDGTREALEEFAAKDSRVRVLHQQWMGLGWSLRTACEKARGEFLARQDADDESLPMRLARQIEYMDAHPDVAVCGTWARIVDASSGPEVTYEPPDDHRTLYRMLERGVNPLIHGSAMIRRAHYDAERCGYRFGGPAQDYDLWLRLSAHGLVGMVCSVEYVYHRSQRSVSFGTIDRRDEVVRVMLQLHRERQRHGREITPTNDIALLRRSAAAPGGTFSAVSCYVGGLHRLRYGDWEGYWRYMGDAAAGSGPYAKKARWHLRLVCAAPLVRLIYDLRYRGGVERYVRVADKR